MPLIRLENLEQFAAVNLNLDPGRIAGPKVIANACMVRLNWLLTDGKTAHNVLYASYTGSPPLSATLAETIRTQITSGATWTTYAGFLASTCGLASVTLLDVRTNVGTEFNSTGGIAAGTSSGTALPDEVAVVISLRTTTRGPGGRGRTYMPGFASNATAAGGVIAPAVITATNALATQIQTVLTNNIGAWVLGLPARAAYTSPVTGRQFPARASGTLGLTGTTVRDNHWDSQRRRGLK